MLDCVCESVCVCVSVCVSVAVFHLSVGVLKMRGLITAHPLEGK